MWGAFFNASSADPFKGELQERSVASILAFMPSTPNFAYHGSAAGWGDFSNNGARLHPRGPVPSLRRPLSLSLLTSRHRADARLYIQRASDSFLLQASG